MSQSVLTFVCTLSSHYNTCALKAIAKMFMVHYDRAKVVRGNIDMSNRETVMINGRVYDRATGMPIAPAVERPAENQAHSALSMHSSPAKSTTLSRRYVKKPDYITAHQQVATATATLEVEKEYPAITRFTAPMRAMATRASADQVVAPRSPRVVRDIRQVRKVRPQAAETPDITPGVHPFVQRVDAVRAQSQMRVAKPSVMLKNEAIEKALANASASSTESKGRRRREKDHSVRDKQAKFSRRLTYATGGFAMLLIGAYFTYISMPALSVRVAAAQAGVHASYPAYRPSGYSLAGAVAYQQGSVSMDFKQNGGKDGFTLTQANSGWDSSALLENYVVKQNNGQFDVSHDNGLTIYTYGNNAAWVSGGILYTIASDATLSNDQIQKIATSM